MQGSYFALIFFGKERLMVKKNPANAGQINNKNFGAVGENRTHDLFPTKEVLYP